MTNREIDVLVAEKVMGLSVQKVDPEDDMVWVEGRDWAMPGDFIITNPDGSTPSICPSFSTDIADAWRVVEKLAPLAGNYHAGDGFFVLKYGEFADHGEHESHCPMPEAQEGENSDPTPWSAHFHLGAMSNAEYPADWEHFQKFCARGHSAAQCICIAALKSVGISHG